MDKGLEQSRLKGVTAAVTLALVSLWLLLPVIRSGYLADDIPNSQRSAWLIEAHEGVWSYTVRLTRQWMTNEGRFFPVSVLENTLLFDLVHSRFLYKSMQIGAVVLVISLLVTFLKRLTGRGWRFPTLCGLGVLCAVQIRTWYDPIISFGLLLPSATAKILIALILVCVGIESKRSMMVFVAFLGAAILWFAALLQYEVVLLLGWIPLGIAYLRPGSTIGRRIAAVSSIAIPSLIVVAISRIVRAGVIPSPAYETNLQFGTVLRTLKFQATGAFPFATLNPSIDGRPGPLESLRSISVFGWLIVLSALVLFVFLIRGMGELEPRIRLVLVAIGTSFWLFPAVPTSMSVRWQSELGPGKAYLPVFLGYIGVGVLLAVGLEFAFSSLRRIELSGWAVRVLTVPVAAVLVLCLAVNHAGFNHVVNSYSGFRTDRELFENAARDGLFDHINTGSVILSEAADPNMWVNPVYLNWLGGPSGTVIVRPEETQVCAADGPQWCQFPTYYFLTQAGAGADQALFVVEVASPPSQPTKWEDVRSIRGTGSRRLMTSCTLMRYTDEAQRVHACRIDQELRLLLKIPD